MTLCLHAVIKFIAATINLDYTIRMHSNTDQVRERRQIMLLLCYLEVFVFLTPPDR